MINICFVEWRCMCKKSSEFVDHLFLVELFTEHVIDPCINFSCSNGLSWDLIASLIWLIDDLDLLFPVYESWLVNMGPCIGKIYKQVLHFTIGFFLLFLICSFNGEMVHIIPQLCWKFGKLFLGLNFTKDIEVMVFLSYILNHNNKFKLCILFVWVQHTRNALPSITEN